MLTDMLQALEEGQTVDSSDVITDLHVACQQMQRRVMSLVSQLTNEDLLRWGERGRGGGREKSGWSRMTAVASLPSGYSS